jgi:hypothetical protein
MTKDERMATRQTMFNSKNCAEISELALKIAKDDKQNDNTQYAYALGYIASMLASKNRGY